MDRHSFKEPKMLTRELEFALGTTGGVLGLLGSLLYILFTVTMEPTWAIDHLIPGATRIIASIVAIFFSFKVQYEPKRTGWILIVCAWWLYLLANVTKPASVVLLIAGLLCLFRK